MTRARQLGSWLAGVAVLGLAAAPRAAAHEGEQHGTPGATAGSLGPVTLSDAAKRALGVETYEVALRTIEQRATCYGTVEPIPDREYWASTRFPGRVVRLFADTGASVAAGDVLAEIESREVAERPVVVPLRTPISGTVTERGVAAGQPVEPMSVLFRVTDLSTVYVRCNVYETDAAEIAAGQPASIAPEALPERSAIGTVARVGGALDEQSRTLPVWIAVGNAERVLRPGMRVRADVVVAASRDAVAIPRRAVLGTSGNLFVFLDQGGSYAGQLVSLGRGDAEYVEIAEGLVPGDRVVTQGAYQLQFAAANAAASLGSASAAAAPVPPPEPGDAAPRQPGAGLPAAGVQLGRLAQQNLGIVSVSAEPRTFDRVVECYGIVQPPPADLHHVTTRTPGRVSRVFVLDGEPVRAGQLLAEIESRQLGEPPPTVKVYADIGGVVIERHVFPGEPVAPEKSLFTIARLDELFVKCQMAEAGAAVLAVGQPARITTASLPGAIFDGSLAYLGGAIDPATRTLPVYVRLETPDPRLRPNMRTRVDIVTARQGEGIAVPQEAVLSDDAAAPFVFVQSGDTFRRQPVRLGQRDDRYVEIVDGVLPGDMVVTRGNRQLPFATDSPTPPAEASPVAPATAGTGTGAAR